VDAGAVLHAARTRAGLSQARLASLANTSQATISAYENGSKQPSVATFSRLLAATGTRLAVESMVAPVVEPSPAELERAGQTLAEVIALAEALPYEPERELRYPRLAA
jgi:uncharacterized protein